MKTSKSPTAQVRCTPHATPGLTRQHRATLSPHARTKCQEAMRELLQELGVDRSSTAPVTAKQLKPPVRKSQSTTSPQHWLTPLTATQAQELWDREILVNVLVERDSERCQAGDILVLTHDGEVVGAGTIIRVAQMPRLQTSSHALFAAQVSVMEYVAHGTGDADLADDLQVACAQFERQSRAIDLAHWTCEGHPNAMRLKDQTLGEEIALNFAFARMGMQNVLHDPMERALHAD